MMLQQITEQQFVDSMRRIVLLGSTRVRAFIPRYDSLRDCPTPPFLWSLSSAEEWWAGFLPCAPD